MDLFALTKSTTFIIGPIASLLGYIMEGIYWFCGLFGVENIGLYIVLFTVVVNIILLPLTIKQQKYTKMNAIMQPEIQAVQQKYKGKTDQQSMQMQQTEMNAIYQKYGTSPTSGCLPLLIQLPIMFALYQIVYNIPAYVSGIYKIFQNVAEPLMNEPGYIDKVNTFIDANKISVKVAEGNMNSIVDFLYKLSSSQWNELAEVFPSITEQINTASAHVAEINSFIFGINLMDSPGFALTPALIIPLLAGITQWLSVKIMQSGQKKPSGNDDNGAMKSMNMMNNIMPFMSVFFCITLPAYIGIYWVASSAVRTVIQLIINQFMKNADMDKMIEKSVAKRNKKLERKGIINSQISERANVNTKSTIYNNSNINTANIKTDYNTQVNSEPKTDNTASQSKTGLFGRKTEAAPTRSIAEKARLVNSYNEKNQK